MSLQRLEGAWNLARHTHGAERWTAEEWLMLHDAYQACEWDYPPDRWTPKQVAEALRGVVPLFDKDGRPM